MSHWSAPLEHEQSVFTSARNVFKRSIVQEKKKQIDFLGFNISNIKMLYFFFFFFFLQIKKKVKQFRKFACTLF